MERVRETKVNPLQWCLPTCSADAGLRCVALLQRSLGFDRSSRRGVHGGTSESAAPDVLSSRLPASTVHLFPIVMTGSTYLMIPDAGGLPAEKQMMTAHACDDAHLHV